MRYRILVCGLALFALGCGTKKKQPPSKGGKTASMRPAAPAAAPTRIQKRLVLSAPEKQRFAALEKLVKGWPKTRGALPAALGLLRADKENRGGLALSLARIGRPLVKPLIAFVNKSPRHLPTARAAGALAYHLLLRRGGLSKRSDAELRQIRQDLRPVFERIYALFLTDTRPEYEIYQGVAVGGAEAIKRFGLPIVDGGLTRVAMVLYLILSNKADEEFLPAAERAAQRKKALPLAKVFAEALPNARFDGQGESPDSLLLGLSVLGADAARALVAVEGLRKQAACLVLIKAAHNLLDQFPAAEVAPLRPALQRCARFKWDANPNVPPEIKRVLEHLATSGNAAHRPRPTPAKRPDSKHDRGHGHKH